MIFDSVVWKEDLKTEMDSFRNFLDITDLNFDEEYEENEDSEERDMYEVVFIKLQKFTIYTSIVIRKMIESKRLSDELEQMSFPVAVHPKIIEDIVNKYSLSEGIETIYDYNKSTESTINLKKLTDMLIHSFIFQPKFDWHKEDESLPDDEAEFIASKVLGFYFNSDWSKDKHLYFIGLDTYFGIVDTVITDRVVYYSTDSKGNVLIKSSRSGKRPDLDTESRSYTIG
jgi:hypothetical protein